MGWPRSGGPFSVTPGWHFTPGLVWVNALHVALQGQWETSPFGACHSAIGQGLHDDAYMPSLALSIVTCSEQPPLSAQSRAPFRPCTPPCDDQSHNVGRCSHLSTSRPGVDVFRFPVYHLTWMDTQFTGRTHVAGADADRAGSALSDASRGNRLYH